LGFVIDAGSEVVQYDWIFFLLQIKHLPVIISKFSDLLRGWLFEILDHLISDPNGSLSFVL
jgi:hypothetical protein